jgi:hypothetical protein
MNPTIQGNGSYGVVYSNPRLPYLKKFKFFKKYYDLDNNDNSSMDNNYNIDNNKDDNSDDNNETDNSDEEYENEDESDYEYDNYDNDNFLKNEVSKVFFSYKIYKNEKKEYIYILSNYNIPDEYFNSPLNYGSVNKDYIINNVSSFNYFSYEKKFKNVYSQYLKSKYQITSLKGIKLEDYDIYNNFEINKNILFAVNYLNNNNYLYDDLKYDNLLIFDDTIKIIDFSTLLHIDDINLKSFKNSMLNTIFYHIYNPILNVLLYYYIYANENNYLSIDTIIQNIVRLQNYDDDNLHYINYNKNLVKNTYDFIIKIDNKNNKNKYFKKIFKNIYFYLYQQDTKKYYKSILNKFIKYFKNKYNNNYDILKELILRINNYSLGIIFLQYLHDYLNNRKMEELINNKIFIYKLFDIFKLCCLQFDINNGDNSDYESEEDSSDNNIKKNDFHYNNFHYNYFCNDNINNIEILDIDFNEVIDRFMN